MANNKVNLSRIVFFVILLIAILLVCYKLFIRNPPNTTIVNKELLINGTVTGVNKARGYKIYLNNSDTPYNFDHFYNFSVSLDDALGYYISVGDIVKKASNSDTLKLIRNNKTQFWLYH